VIAHQQQESFTADKIARAKHRMSIPARASLFYELKPATFDPGRDFVGSLVSGRDHHADLLHAGRKDFVDQYPQRCFG
jgi:hypothetical protein